MSISVSNLPLVCLHGWGADKRVWSALRTVLPNSEIISLDLPGFGESAAVFTSIDAACDELVAQLPTPCDVLGWSLGGLLAWHIAARYPHIIRSVITLGSNPCFVACDGWPGMAPTKYAQFCDGFAQDSTLTRKRFLQLQVRGEPDAEVALAALQTAMPEQMANAKSWQRALAALQTDARLLLPTLTMPVLHVLAGGDVLAPIALAQVLPTLVPQQQVQILAQCGHAAQITQPSKVAKSVTDFLAQVPYAIQQSQVAQSFDRAAAQYQQHALLQQEVAVQLVQTVREAPLHTNATVLDAGCGTGAVAELVLASGLAQQVIGVDIAEGMLQQAAARQLPNTRWQQGDLHALPLPDACVDAVVSSLTLQWCARPAQVFAEWRRVLRPQGGVWFSTILPGTLQELQQSWGAVDDAVHVNQFCPVADTVTMLNAAGLSVVNCNQYTLVHRHRELRGVLNELKAIGAHNMNVGRPRGLMGKHRWQQFVRAYDALRDADGLLPVTYQVLIIHAIV